MVYLKPFTAVQLDGEHVEGLVLAQPIQNRHEVIHSHT
jgi:hypothetical protein